MCVCVCVCVLMCEVRGDRYCLTYEACLLQLAGVVLRVPLHVTDMRSEVQQLKRQLSEINMIVRWSNSILPFLSFHTHTCNSSLLAATISSIFMLFH